MNLKEYLISIGVGSFLSFIICILVIFNFDPNIKGFLPQIFFYLSLFMGLLGSFVFTNILIKSKINQNEEIIFRQIKKIFRQGLIFSILIMGLLFLAHKDFLNWLTFLLILFFYLIFEGIIFSTKKL